MHNKTNSIFKKFVKIQQSVAAIFELDPLTALSSIIFTSVVIIVGLFWFFHSAPPSTIIITSGDDGTAFRKNAEKYAKILARNGVKLKILPSEGSLENLGRLGNPAFKVDVGFVQTGVAKGQNTDKLVSLGSIFYEPLYIFYRSKKPIELLSQFAGKKIAIGEEGTGTRVLALELLERNGIKPGGPTELLGLDDDEAKLDLFDGKIDAVFMMSDSASVETMRELRLSPNIWLYDFTQADAYTRRFSYLNKTVIPRGGLDFEKDIPAHDINLVSPTVELIARADLHPALSDLLLDAATEVNSRAGLLQKRGEFPAPHEQDFRISADASRYYKSGKSFLYRYLPFWIASLLNRILVVFVPMILIFVPGIRSIPVLYQWHMRLRIFRLYNALTILEKDMIGPVSTEKTEGLQSQIETIENALKKMKVPSSFAEQLSDLRGHIDSARSKLASIPNAE
jgi:TRAP-type uncharacterized transport system substrate-binding protein